MPRPEPASPERALAQIEVVLLGALADAMELPFDGIERQLRPADQIRLRHLRRWHAAELQLMQVQAALAATAACADAAAMAAGEDTEHAA